MLTVNIDIPNCLINCQTGNVRYITFAQSSVVKVYERFSDEQVGLIGIKSSYLGRQKSWVSIRNMQLRFK